MKFFFAASFWFHFFALNSFSGTIELIFQVPIDCFISTRTVVGHY